MGGQCYYFDTTGRTKEDAKSYCTSNHGKLWEPKTMKRINEVYTKAITVSNQHWWIGMSDIESEGTFKFDSNGEKFPFLDKQSPWEQNEPGGGSAESCAIMLEINTLEFHDQLCSKKWHSICESTSIPEGNEVKIFKCLYNFNLCKM